MSIKSEIEKEFDLIIAAFKKKDLHNSNIYCNRLITDSAINKLKKVTLSGAILKKILTQLLRFENREEYRFLYKKFIDILDYYKRAIKDENITYSSLWDRYNTYFTKTREYLLDQYEKEHIGKNLDFSKKIIRYCTKFFCDYFEEGDPTQLMTYGVELELSRVIKNYSCSIEELVLETLFQCFNRYFEYIRFNFYGNKSLNKEPSSKINEEYTKYVKEFKVILNKYLDNEEDYISIASEFIFSISLSWREMYIRFLDIIPKKPKYKIIPKETDEKIGEILSEMTKKERILDE